MKLDLSFIPFANNYDETELLDLWCFGDKNKGEDIWHVTIHKDKLYATIDPVPSTNELEAGGFTPFEPPTADGIPCWEVYGDRLYSAQTSLKPPVDWLWQLQALLPEWDGIYRNPLPISAQPN